jgi:TPR repeat protein
VIQTPEANLNIDTSSKMDREEVLHIVYRSQKTVKAIDYLTMAAEQGHTDALVQLGIVYRKGLKV